MYNGKGLEVINDWKNLKEKIENHIKGKGSSGQTIQILEAGCGQRWGPNLAEVSYYLTGVDLDKAALEIRKNIVNDLDEIIEGDLRPEDTGTLTEKDALDMIDEGNGKTEIFIPPLTVIVPPFGAGPGITKMAKGYGKSY